MEEIGRDNKFSIFVKTTKKKNEKNEKNEKMKKMKNSSTFTPTDCLANLSPSHHPSFQFPDLHAAGFRASEPNSPLPEALQPSSSSFLLREFGLVIFRGQMIVWNFICFFQIVQF